MDGRFVYGRRGWHGEDGQDDWQGATEASGRRIADAYKQPRLFDDPKPEPVAQELPL